MHQEKADLGADDQARVAPFHPLQVGQSPVDNWEKTVGAPRHLAVRESGGEWVGGGRAWDQAALAIG